MIYEKLLLANKGGIRSPGMQNALLTGYNTLVLGLGGVGVDALSVFRGEMHRRVRPVDGRYPGVSILGIDSDRYNRERYKGDCRLSEDEFLNLCENMPPMVRPDFLYDPHFDWLPEDVVRLRQGVGGTGAVRQIGRAFLMQRVENLISKLERVLCEMIDVTMDTRFRVHMVTGLGGGTGSGIYADVCYLLQHIAQMHGWHLDIQGYYLLPCFERITPADRERFEHINRNSYAALRELDYLLNLPTRAQWFHQIYRDGVVVHTQAPPTNVSYLIGGTDLLGYNLPNGYQKVMELLADHMVEHLIDPALWYPVPRAPENTYRILGCHVAEIPKTEVLTQLSDSLLRHMVDKFKKNADCTRERVMNFAQEYGLTLEAVLREMEKQLPLLYLEPLNASQLRSQLESAHGEPGQIWKQTVARWMEDADRNVQEWLYRQKCNLLDYNPQNANLDTPLGRVFVGLYDICRDPQRGIYCARNLVKGMESNLLQYLEGQRMYLQDLREREILRERDIQHEMLELRQRLLQPLGPFSASRREQYQELTETLVRCRFRQHMLRWADTWYSCLDRQLRQLDESYLQPIMEVFEKLCEIGAANEEWLQRETDAQVLTCQRNYVANTLFDKDWTIEATDILMQALTERLENERDIAQLLREIMLRLFAEAENTPTTQFLRKFTQGNPGKYRDIVQDLHRAATPTIQIRDSALLNLPQLTRLQCSAADPMLVDEIMTFCALIPNCVAGTLAQPGRMTVHQIVQNVRLRDLPYVEYMAHMDSQRPIMPGSYLYEASGRGGESTGNISWRDVLPPVELRQE